jgi:hypothetical protein
MRTVSSPPLGRRAAATLLLAAVLITSCQGAEEAGPADDPVPPDAAESDEPASDGPVEGLLRVEPASGVAGDPATIEADDLPPGAEVAFEWVTWHGYYETEVVRNGVKFVGARYDERRLVLGTATADAEGRVAFDFEVPSDYGGAHDIFAVVDDVALARGGFQIRRQVTVTPEEGPVGTPITVRVEGLDRWPFGRALSVRYGNAYTGFISGVTTRGTGIAVLRAAGPPGLHTVELSGLGVHGGGFLTNHQSPYANLYPASGAYRATFRVTEDQGGSEPVLDWPDHGRVAKLDSGAPFPTAAGISTPAGMTFDITPNGGPVATPIQVQATGLAPDAAVSMVWATVGGSGGGVAELDASAIPLGDFRTGPDGSLTATVDSPDHLGGWHAVQLVVDQQIVAEEGFYMERSLVSAPQQVRVGEAFTVELRGGGLYDLDSGFGITYNNAYIGYACGFTAKGPVVIHFVASGTPGTDLIDIYPMVYRGVGGSGEDPWGYQMPHLNSLEDHPGLDLGMRLPIIRLSIDVVE